MVFIYICLIVFNIIAIFMPKRLTKIEVYATCFFAIAFGRITDSILDAKLNLYGFLAEGIQYLGIFTQLLIYPSISTLFLNYFPFDKSVVAKSCYVLAWSLFSIGFEWISLQTNFFYYRTWKLWYSAMLYPIIFYILYANLKLVRKLMKS